MLLGTEILYVLGIHTSAVLGHIKYFLLLIAVITLDCHHYYPVSPLITVLYLCLSESPECHENLVEPTAEGTRNEASK